MAYIGKTPAQGNFVKLDAITCSSTNTYNLTSDSVAFVPESALHMMVSLNGVIQAPLTSFSISGSTITFLPSSGTLSSSDTIDFILVLGNVLDIGTPSDSTVTNAKTNFVSTSSSAGLQIKGDNTTAGTLQLNCEQNSHGIKLQSPAHSANQSYTLKFPTGNVTADKFLKVASITGSGTTGVGQLSFADASSTEIKDADADTKVQVEDSSDADRISFTTGGTMRGYVDSSGNMGIKGNASTNGFATLTDIQASLNTTGMLRIVNGDNHIARFNWAYNGNQVGGITHNGSATAFNTSSDYRLKENVDYTFDATTRLKQLKPCRFNFIVDDTNTLVDGFLAHEVSSVVPEAINGTKDAVDADGSPIMQGIDQSKIVPLLVKTIQELEARITALE